MEQILFIVVTLLLFVAFPGIGKTAKHAGQLVIDNQRKLILGTNLEPIRETENFILLISSRKFIIRIPKKRQSDVDIHSHVNNFSLKTADCITGLVEKPKKPP